MLLISENGQLCEVGKAFGLGGVSLLRGEQEPAPASLDKG